MWTPALLLLATAAALALLRPLAVLAGADVRDEPLARDGREALGRLWEHRTACPACGQRPLDLSAHLTAVHPVDEGVLTLAGSIPVDFELLERRPVRPDAD